MFGNCSHFLKICSDTLLRCNDFNSDICKKNYHNIIILYGNWFLILPLQLMQVNFFTVVSVKYNAEIWFLFFVFIIFE